MAEHKWEEVLDTAYDSDIRPNETADDLQKRHNELSLATVLIRSHIDKHKAEGPPRRWDKDWLCRAETALRLKQRAMQILIREIAVRRKREGRDISDRDQRVFGVQFVEVARTRLDREKFMEIAEEARRRVNRDTGSSTGASTSNKQS